VLPSVAGQDGDLCVREWTQDDASGLIAAVAESLEHLRPWMAWAAHTSEETIGWRLQVQEWAMNRAAGRDAVYGIFVAGVPTGGCGLHWRLGQHGLEIGYWVRREYLRRGIATRAARLLTNAAFQLKGIDFVEIHHDRANNASRGVPQGLGYTLSAEVEREPQAPGEVGIECQWLIKREEWGEQAASAIRARGEANADVLES